MSKRSERHVVVTTDKDRRGVFGGILAEHDAAARTAVLRDARIAVYWSAQTRGVLGLASLGPADGSRISPSVPRLELNGVTAVMDMTDEAWARWEAEPWD